MHFNNSYIEQLEVSIYIFNYIRVLLTIDIAKHINLNKTKKIYIIIHNIKYLFINTYYSQAFTFKVSHYYLLGI